MSRKTTKRSRRALRPSVDSLEGRQLLSTVVTRPPATAWTAGPATITVAQGQVDHFTIPNVATDGSYQLDMQDEQSVFDPKQPLSTMWAVVTDHATGAQVDNEILSPTSTTSYAEVTGHVFSLQQGHQYDLYLNEGTVGGSDILIQNLNLASVTNPAYPVLHFFQSTVIAGQSGCWYGLPFDAPSGTTWSAKVNWGDGSPIDNDSTYGPIDVGTGFALPHTYNTPGVYHGTWTVTSVNNPNISTTGIFTVNVVQSTWPLEGFEIRPLAVSAIAGQNSPLQVCYWGAAIGSHVNISVNWGDGGTTVENNVAYSEPNQPASPFPHTYSTPGVYTGTVTMTSVENPNVVDTVNFVATVTA